MNASLATHFCGPVRVKILGKVKPNTDCPSNVLIKVKVTSNKNRFYKRGEVIEVFARELFLYHYPIKYGTMFKGHDKIIKYLKTL